MIALVNANALSIPLADESCHMVVTSPPYYSLRSYAGTAKWVGGDEGCDHVANPKATKVMGNPEFNENRPSREETKLAGYYADTCPKCGATRVDGQLGLEKKADCLGWATGDIWELRPDLTDEEIVYVYRELIKAGVVKP